MLQRENGIMLRRVSGLKGYEFQAVDGRFGTVSDMLFDDVTWKARWIVADTGGWLGGRELLIHPSAIGQPDDAQRLLPVSLTKARLKASSDIGEDQPVSRQMEASLRGYDGYDGWGSMWVEPIAVDNATFSPWGAPPVYGDSSSVGRHESNGKMNNWDPHLRSASAVTGYRIHATDGDIGHVESLLVEGEGWAIRYLVVNTSDWWLGHQTLIAPPWITDIDWLDATVSVDLTRQTIKYAPAYDPSALPSPDQERALFDHYDRPNHANMVAAPPV